MNTEEKNLKKEKLKKVLSLIKLGLLILIIIVIPFYIYFVHPELLSRVSSIDKVRQLFSDYGNSAVFLYILAQVTQIVICIIPGQWLQIGAGIAWGFWIGYLLSFLGALIGSIITYYLADWLGRDAMHVFFGEEQVEHYTELFNSKKALIIVFLVYLIPGLPKDLCSYVAGISKMKAKPFIIISLIGRTPGMMGSLLFGQQLGEGGYIGAVIICIIAILLFALGIIFHKKIIKWSDKIYEKLMKT